VSAKKRAGSPPDDASQTTAFVADAGQTTAFAAEPETSAYVANPESYVQGQSQTTALGYMMPHVIAKPRPPSRPRIAGDEAPTAMDAFANARAQVMESDGPTTADPRARARAEQLPRQRQVNGHVQRASSPNAQPRAQREGEAPFDEEAPTTFDPSLAERHNAQLARGSYTEQQYGKDAARRASALPKSPARPSSQPPVRPSSRRR
jgi:hypothetical protein